MNKLKLLFLLSVLAILMGYSTRIARMVDRKVIFHDETWSYLNATGHLGQYSDEIVVNGSYPTGVWVDSDEWKRFITLDNRFVFDQIRDDIVQLDEHPPLYFWILHLWTIIFGTSIWGGLLLNIFLETILLIVLLIFCFENSKDHSESLLVVSAWFINPISMDTSGWIRQYVLLSLWSLLFAYILFKMIYQPNNVILKPLQAVLFLLVSIAGIMTHYYFLFLLISGVVLVGLRYGKKAYKRLFSVLSYTLISCFFFFIIYPEFHTQITSYGQSTFDMQLLGDVYYRIYRTLRINLVLFSQVILALLLFGWHFIRQNGGIRSRFRLLISDIREQTENQPVFAYMIGLTILFVGATNFLYISRFSPQHAMAAKYVNHVSPFVAFIPLLILILSRRKNELFSLFYVGIILLGIATALYPLVKGSNNVNAKMIAPSELIVIDNLSPGLLGTVVFSLHDENMVFAESQSDLISEQDEWIPRLSEQGGVYVSTGGKNSTDEDRKELIRLLKENNRVELYSTLALNDVTDWRLFKPVIYRVFPKTEE